MPPLMPACERAHLIPSADGLAVVDLRSADVALYLELAPQAVHNDLQVQLTHALQQDSGKAHVSNTGPPGLQAIYSHL